MFSISFIVRIISTILIVQSGHCEQKRSASSIPSSHILENAAKIESGPELKSTESIPAPSKFNSSFVEESKHRRKIKNTSVDNDPASQPVIEAAVEAKTGNISLPIAQVVPQKSVLADKKVATKETPPLSNTKIDYSENNVAKFVSNNSANIAQITSKPIVEKSTNRTTKTATVTTSTTTATTTTTTATPAPKKPTVTFSVEDIPDLLNSIRKSSVSEIKGDDTEQPRLLQSSESINDRGSGHDFLAPMIGMIFLIPFLIIVVNFTTRRIRDYWSKRMYRRMDYLIEDMYN